MHNEILFKQHPFSMHHHHKCQMLHSQLWSYVTCLQPMSSKNIQKKIMCIWLSFQLIALIACSLQTLVLIMQLKNTFVHNWYSNQICNQLCWNVKLAMLLFVFGSDSIVKSQSILSESGLMLRASLAKLLGSALVGLLAMEGQLQLAQHYPVSKKGLTGTLQATWWLVALQETLIFHQHVQKRRCHNICYIEYIYIYICMP